jgi:hypothetical protein
MRDQVFFQLVQLSLLGEDSVPEQKDDFFKFRVLGQRVDIDSAIIPSRPAPVTAMVSVFAP